MEHTWRWFGPNDTVSLWDARQAGAVGIVTALHHIPTGEIWQKEEITKRKLEVEKGGMYWSVAESIPVHENIKTRNGLYKTLIENYKTSLRNLGSTGVDTVCYNFMPVLDATRTDFYYPLEDRSTALLFDKVALAAFELFLLKRPRAEQDYSAVEQQKAADYFKALSPSQRESLTSTVVAGFPGIGADYTLAQFQAVLDTYQDISASDLRSNLIDFLKEIIPVAEEAGIRMAIHPDDPPFPVLGLPRIVSTESDVQALFDAVNHPHNGLTFCTGSFGVRRDNDLPGMVARLGDRIHFVHLRSTQWLSEEIFIESDHLTGDVDMYAVIKALLKEKQARKTAGRHDTRMPMRADHGHQMLDDLNKKTVPGYSAIGRLRGLAELRGLTLAIERAGVE